MKFTEQRRRDEQGVYLCQLFAIAVAQMQPGVGLVLPTFSAPPTMWGILFLFPKEERETDPEKDTEITELVNKGIRILSQKLSCPRRAYCFTHSSVPFPEAEARLVQVSSHDTSIMFSGPLSTGTLSTNGVSFFTLASQAPGLLYTVPFWDRAFVLGEEFPTVTLSLCC